jgi:hypothetical protein
LNALNILGQSQNIEFPVIQNENFDFQNSKETLHQIVMKYMKASKLEELEEILVNIEDSETFFELQDESFNLILPIIMKWLERKTLFLKYFKQNLQR